MLDLCLKSTSLLENFKEISIISLVDKDSNVLNDKKEAVIKTPLSDQTLLKTEKVTTSD